MSTSRFPDYKRVARIGEEFKDTPACLIKQKESGKPSLNAFRVFTELEKYVANSEIYGDAPTGIVITLKGKYRVETVSFGKWFDFDTYQEAIGFISDWIKAGKEEVKVAASK